MYRRKSVRAQTTVQPTVWKRKAASFFSRVETGYAHMADLHSHRFRVIDASGPVGEVYRRTRAAVNEEFGWLGTGAAAGGTRSGGPVVPAECDLEGHGTV